MSREQQGVKDGGGPSLRVLRGPVPGDPNYICRLSDWAVRELGLNRPVKKIRYRRGSGPGGPPMCGWGG